MRQRKHLKEAQKNYALPYAAVEGTSLQNPFISYSLPRPGLSAQIRGYNSNGETSSDFSFTTEEQERLFPGMSDSDQSSCQEQLLHEMELLHMQALAEEFEDQVDDETVANIAEDFQNLGTEMVAII
jgi:hypothetical protein